MIRYFIVIISLVASLSCSAEPGEVSVEKFREYAAVPMGTVVFSEYEGIREDRAYITVHKMSVPSSNWTETTYWVKTNKLSLQEISTLEAARAK